MVMNMLSFTFDEKILNLTSLESFSKFDILNDINYVELSPDNEVLPLIKYKKIINTLFRNKMLNYHIPYFANNDYEIFNFKSRENRIKKKYINFLNTIFELNLKPAYEPIIVLHGAKYESIKYKETGIDDTLFFLDWFLNLIDKKNLKLKLAIETVEKSKYRTIGDITDDLFLIVGKFNNKVGICLDIAHYTKNNYPNNNINANILNSTIYSHIHGVDLKNNFSHISILKSDFDFKDFILLMNQRNVIINIELLVNFCKDSYVYDLLNDIKYLKSISYI